MGVFSNFGKAGLASGAETATPPIQKPTTADGQNGSSAKPRRRKTGRTCSYSVRVRDGFKGEILGLLAEMQVERLRLGGDARKFTEGELIEIMLSAFTAARQGRPADGMIVPLTADVWQGVQALARAQRTTPAIVLEELVVQKVAALGLVPRKTD